jgi:hypothetical protein
MDSYRYSLNGREAAWAVRKYKGHRGLPPEAAQEIAQEFMARKS